MATIIGEEHVCYSESSTTGHFSPLIGILKYDGSVSFRDVVKEDLARIYDEEIFPGSWLFRQTVLSTGSWVKRFAILRGDFIFLFHSPANEKPIAIIPLLGAKIVVPEDNEKTFDEQRHFRANEGFEFDIRHTSRPTVRLYALSDHERNEWVNACKKRCYGNAFDSNENFSKALPPGSNISVTSTKLSGLLLSGNVGADMLPEVQSSHAAFMSPKPEPETAKTATDFSMRALSMKSLSPATSHFSLNELTRADNQQDSLVNLITNNTNGNMFSDTTNPLGSSLSRKKEQDVLMRRNTLNMDRFSQLEEELSRIMAVQSEARLRYDLVKAKMASKEAIQEARGLEEKNPLSLAELFRQLLFFYDAELAEDPQQDSAQQFPHVKGAASEAMILQVYQRYCSESGFMALEQFIEFMEDSAILQTHAPHDDNDEPLEEYKNSLDPVRLIFSVPKLDATIDINSSYYMAHEKQLKATSKDKFTIGFGQFYQILLHITQIVYTDLYAEDETVAFNKILLEVICPMFVWSKGRHKRGAVDPLVIEERILLVMITYAPNLWKLFLTYATDAVGKIPEISLSFPESAQLNERGMFKLPPVAPDHFYTESYRSMIMDSLIVTETGCLKFARDYGMTPYLLSQAHLREHFKAVNRNKVIVSSRLPSREQVAVRTTLVVDRTKKKEAVSTMQFGRRRESRFGTPAGTANKKNTMKASVETKSSANEETAAPTVSPPASQPATGLSFSEFAELIVRMAVENMQQPNYHVIFPTPFSKVLAILTVWGVADLDKLEEVRTIRTDEAY